MSLDFIKEGKGRKSLEKAERQQDQLRYFLVSDVQEDFNEDYFHNYIQRKHYNDDQFLNYAKNVLKEDNFLSFAKYYRNPNPSSKLIDSRVKEPLSRVFFSEDSYFNYIINGRDVDYPAELDDDFDERLFDAVLFRHNDIIIHDVKGVNNPYRFFLCIDKVVSIHVELNDIEKIAYTAQVEINGEKITGYAYLDSVSYKFYEVDNEIPLMDVPHDLGICPATFVSKDRFDNDPIVRKSIFSYLRGDLEEYVFLKTLQKMVEPNGSIPITVKIESKEITDGSDDFDANNGEPMSVDQLGSQVPREARSRTTNKGSVMQAGTEITVPAIEKTDGSIDTDLAKNFITFFYIPVEALKYLNDRIGEIEKEIVTSSIGDYSEGVEGSMNEKQIQKTFVSKEDKLRWLSNTMSWARMKSDKMILALKHGSEKVKVDAFYGSDFFWETPEKLFKMFVDAPNSIERKSILIRLTKRRNIFNREKKKRDTILYQIMPYACDKDFQMAIDRQVVDDLDFELQSRFHYYINLFEAEYGSIVAFWEGLGDNDAQKIVLLNQLLIKLIKNGKEVSSTP